MSKRLHLGSIFTPYQNILECRCKKTAHLNLQFVESSECSWSISSFIWRFTNYLSAIPVRHQKPTTTGHLASEIVVPCRSVGKRIICKDKSNRAGIVFLRWHSLQLSKDLFRSVKSVLIQHHISLWKITSCPVGGAKHSRQSCFFNKLSTWNGILKTKFSCLSQFFPTISPK